MFQNRIKLRRKMPTYQKVQGGVPAVGCACSTPCPCVCTRYATEDVNHITDLTTGRWTPMKLSPNRTGSIGDSGARASKSGTSITSAIEGLLLRLDNLVVIVVLIGRLGRVELSGRHHFDLKQEKRASKTYWQLKHRMAWEILLKE